MTCLQVLKPQDFFSIAIPWSFLLCTQDIAHIHLLSPCNCWFQLVKWLNVLRLHHLVGLVCLMVYSHSVLYLDSFCLCDCTRPHSQIYTDCFSSVVWKMGPLQPRRYHLKPVRNNSVVRNKQYCILKRVLLPLELNMQQHLGSNISLLEGFAKWLRTKQLTSDL